MGLDSGRRGGSGPRYFDVWAHPSGQTAVSLSCHVWSLAFTEGRVIITSYTLMIMAAARTVLRHL
jgi:hypothetical protein